MKITVHSLLLAAGLSLAAGPSGAQLTTNFLLKTYNNSPEYVNSQIYDNGTVIGIGISAPAEKLDIFGNVRVSGRFISSAPSGTPPLSVSSSTLVSGLNCDLLDGFHAASFSLTGHSHPGMLGGGGTPGQVAFWNGSSSLQGDARLVWNGSNGSLGVGVSVPEARLHLADSSGRASLMLEEAHTLYHGGGLSASRWEVCNQTGELRFVWHHGSQPVSILKFTGGPASGIAELSGMLKATQLCMTYGACNNYLLSSTPSGLAVWKDPTLLTGWTVTGNHVCKTGGHVGIGTSQPQGLLSLYSTTAPMIILESGPGSGSFSYGILCKSNSNDLKALALEHQGDEKMILWGDGRLQVDNIIQANEIEVKIDVWQDAVFDPDYKLMNLRDLESYIHTNRHLPDVPGETEVLEGGIRVGEMNALLLKKIEELTLYVIALEKRLEKQ